jgi:hypothetical protein
MFLRGVFCRGEGRDIHFVEDWVDSFPSCGEFELVRQSSNLLYNGEGPVSFVIKFLDGSVCGDICSF